MIFLFFFRAFKIFLFLHFNITWPSLKKNKGDARMFVKFVKGKNKHVKRKYVSGRLVPLAEFCS